MNPLNFVGTPYWLSAVIAVAFAAIWLALLTGKWLGKFWTWAVIVVGIVAFPLSIAYIQVPIQNGINSLYVDNFPQDTISHYVLLFGIPVIVVSGLVQEVVKFGIAVGGLALLRRTRLARAGLAVGAAAGAAYGGMEAFWVFNTVFAAGYTWGTVQLGGAAALLPFIERFFTVMFHAGVVALSAYGFTTGRPWRFLLLAIGLHSATNYLVLPARVGMISVTGIETGVALIAAGTMAAALWLRFRRREPPPSEPQPEPPITHDT